MRWLQMVVLCTALILTCADPEPKKYKTETKTKEKQSNTTLTEEEKTFLREVEAKFGLKAEIPIDFDKDSNSTKPLFPAVIAIEIVNDTDTGSTKGNKKRTIDANLGYGYRTNNGYTYTYLGKQQDKGKFMVYPYSQEDIPATPYRHSSHGDHSQKQKYSTQVEITPSQAYELVPTKEQPSYQYEKPAVQLNTKYESAEAVQTPPPQYSSHNPSTLYTTYNGGHFSSLSGQFPSVTSNHLVDANQLLQNPQYQSAGLTQDHIQSHGANLVVPILVLRIPSSYIKNPSAELYANTPQNYPLSQYLNNDSLQELVNQYFKKLGYPYPSQVMAYSNSHLASPTQSTEPEAASPYEPQQYASPYVQPSYTHADYSGVHYSAVQPVMAKYPDGYSQPQYYVTREQQSQPQYVYSYRYVPQTQAQAQSYYVQPQSYQEQPQETYQTSQEDHVEQTGHQQTSLHDISDYGAAHSSNEGQDHAQGQVQVASQEYTSQEQTQTAAYNYVTEPPIHAAKEEQAAVVAGKNPYQAYSHQTVQIQHEHPERPISVYHRSQAGHRYTPNIPQTHQQEYTFQNQVQQHEQHPGDDLVLTENYPSKDHTIATVLPLSYKKNTLTSQSVSYVTPIPQMKYQSHYKIMVPQTVFKSHRPEKVHYVNSHSVPGHYANIGPYKHERNPEHEYTISPHYAPPISKQKPPLYPRNHHAHPKRMTRPHKPESMMRSQMERKERKKIVTIKS